MSNPKTEQQKVRELYDLIGERGLYVSSNFDVFQQRPEEVSLGTGYKLPLVKPGTKAYNSPLLFATLTSLLNHGTMFVTGAPGIGKTTGVEFAGHFFSGTPLDEILASEIQGHPQLTEEKLLASYDIGKLVTTGERKVDVTKFMQCPVKVIDEGNRIPADVLSIIQRVADNGTGVYGGKLIKAQPGPLFLTANYTDEGTFQLTPPFLDRFDVAVMVTSPQQWDLKKIRARGDEKLNGGLDKLLTIPEDLKLDFEKLRKQINTMPEATEDEFPLVSSFADFLYGSLRFSEAASDSLARATKGNAWNVSQDKAPPGHFKDSPFVYTGNELSVRTAKAIPRYAKAFAWLNGKEKVELDDLKAVLPYLLWHKLNPTEKAMAENPKHANDRIALAEALIAKVEDEYNELRGTDALKTYTIALDTLNTGKLAGKGEKLTEDQLRSVVRNAITKLGETDKPYAITLASHVASEYNGRVNGTK